MEGRCPLLRLAKSAVEPSDHRHLRLLLRASDQRPCRGAAEKGDELASSHVRPPWPSPRSYAPKIHRMVSSLPRSANKPGGMMAFLKRSRRNRVGGKSRWSLVGA